MDPTQSQNNIMIDDENKSPKIGINITPCEDARSSTPALSSERSLSPSKYKLPISITDLWRIRRKEKLKKRFLARSLMLGNDDGDDDSDSYSFDHDSLATPSINTSQIDPTVDSDNGDYSWSSANSSQESLSSSLDSGSPEEDWGSPPYGDIQRDSHGTGSSEDPLSNEENGRRASICTVIDSHSRSPKSFIMSNLSETAPNLNTIDKESNSGTSSGSNGKISECIADENEEFKQIMRDMTIASFSNKNKNANLGSEESIEEPKDQICKLSNIADPIDLSSINYSSSSQDHFPYSKPESTCEFDTSENLNSENIDKVEQIDNITNPLPIVDSKRDFSKLGSSGGDTVYEDNVIATKHNNSSTKVNTQVGSNKNEIDGNSINKSNKGNHQTESYYKHNVDSSTHEKRHITQSLEFKRIEKTVGLGIDKSCFWCCEIL